MISPIIPDPRRGAEPADRGKPAHHRRGLPRAILNSDYMLVGTKKKGPMGPPSNFDSGFAFDLSYTRSG
jgi:hypothetical protein